MCTRQLKNGIEPYLVSKMQDIQDICNQYQQYLKMDAIAFNFMSKLDIRKEFYMLGGSAALVAYGINIGRIPHDIDIIVARGIYDAVVQIIATSSYYTKPSTDIPSSGHFSVEVKSNDETFIIDILPHNMPIPFTIYKPGFVNLQDLYQIKQIKGEWHRRKDKSDRELITKFLAELVSLSPHNQ